jgi:hypothetical protein
MENRMNRLFKILVLIVFTFVTISCSTVFFRKELKEQTAVKIPLYKLMLGKSLTDKVVADFITSNHCSMTMQYVFCKEVGMDLLVDSNQIVVTVFLYLNKASGFVPNEGDYTAYKGELPFGLKFYDTLEAVEHKLKQQGVGNDGLPDSGTIPDRMHYVATYNEAGITIIYNSAPDEDPTIHAILVNK